RSRSCRPRTTWPWTRGLWPACAARGRAWRWRASWSGEATRPRWGRPGPPAASWPPRGCGCGPCPAGDRPGRAGGRPPGRAARGPSGGAAPADPKPEMLVQFGQLGVAYAQTALGVTAPRVGLLTIGAEPGKGNKFTRRAHELLASDPPGGALPLSFAGNVEGGDLLAGEVDVIVTDGFTGNVALKTLEGSIRFATAELRAAVTATRTARVGAFLQRRGLRALAARLDSESYGGAVLLGLGGTVVIAHGASPPRAATSACLLAGELSRGQFTAQLTHPRG